MVPTCRKVFCGQRGYTVHGIKRRGSLFHTHRIDHLYQDPHEPAPSFILHYGDLHRFRLPAPHHPAGAAGRDLQPGRAESRGGVLRAPDTRPTPTRSARSGSWRPSGCSAGSTKYASIRPSTSEPDGKVQEVPQRESTPRPVLSLCRGQLLGTGSRSTTARPTTCTLEWVSSSTTHRSVAARSS